MSRCPQGGKPTGAYSIDVYICNKNNILYVTNCDVHISIISNPTSTVNLNLLLNAL